MRILVIGGSRFVGPLLIKRLLDDHHDVVLFNRGSRTVAAHPQLKVLRGDRDVSLPDIGHVDTVVDTCAYTGAQTQKVIDRLSFDHLVHVSTAAAYKKTATSLLDETSPLGEWTLWGQYNRGKVECERVLETSGRPYASIRPVYILGPRNPVDREHFIYKKLRAGAPLVLPGDGQAQVQFTFSDDVAECLFRLITKKATGAFNCVSDDVVTLQKLVEMMADICSTKPSFAYDAKADEAKFDVTEFPFANENMTCTNAKAKGLGMTFTPLMRGLQDGYESYYRSLLA